MIFMFFGKKSKSTLIYIFRSKEIYFFYNISKEAVDIYIQSSTDKALVSVTCHFFYWISLNIFLIWKKMIQVKS